MRLNCGAGNVRPTGWVNVEPFPEDWPPERPERLVVADPLTRLPFEDGFFDGAVAHHCLQMVAWPDLVPWLTEVHRVLKPGAVLRLTVPDLLGAFDAYDETNPGWFPIADEIESSIDGRLCVYLSQAGATRSVFTGPWLLDLLSRAGFMDEVQHDEPGITCSEHAWLLDLDDRMDESIVIEGSA